MDLGEEQFNGLPLHPATTLGVSKSRLPIFREIPISAMHPHVGRTG